MACNNIIGTGTWQDARELPAALAATLDQASGFADVARLLAGPNVRRIVVSGNGASFYVAAALWLTQLYVPARGLAEIVAVPSGILAGNDFAWRDGDLLLAISSSGELRDLIEAIENPSSPQSFAAITSNPAATIPSAADACAVVDVISQRAVTHTQAFCGAAVAVMAIYAQLSGDAELTAAVADSPTGVQHAVDQAEEWALTALRPPVECTAAVAYGSGPVWAAAMEGALLIKEIARVPCEAAETREAATASMTSLLPGHFAISIANGTTDSVREETDRICEAAGARVIRPPAGDLHPCLAAIGSFPGVLALSIGLAQSRHYDPDTPEWTKRYYETARQSRDRTS